MARAAHRDELCRPLQEAQKDGANGFEKWDMELP